ncbi:MAG TPA: 16S rRNA (adenine(1518)-N(6)/adenine(1519)-N(6))-dimethyltransferase RsmA [Rhodothermales bacterium]
MTHPLRPLKRLGQNFLTDPNVARKIVASVPAPPEARVVEIGPGTGALTGLLRERFGDVVAIEVDQRAVAVLRERMPDLDVRHLDVLAVDWHALAAERDGAPPLYVVGNLPYYITSQVLFGLLEARDCIASAVVMMQLEVAERLAAAHGSRAYGITSVLLQQYADVAVLFRVSRNVFYPRPDVTSAVVRIDFRGAEPEDSVPFELFRSVTRTAFNQRRKTLRNSLSTLLEERGISLPERWSGRRAEELSPDEFVSLTRFIETGGRLP